MSPTWTGLFGNLALVSVLVLLWGFISEQSHIIPRLMRRIGYGLLCGAFCYIVIAYGTQILPDFKFDLRHALLGVASYFGGPISALIAGSMASFARLEVGGAGTQPGLIGIAISTSVGLVMHYATRRRQHLISSHVLLSCALMFGLGLSFVAVPAELRLDLLRSVGLPLFGLNFVATLVATILIGRQLHQRDTVQINRIYARMVQELPECLNAKDRDGRFIAANSATARLMRATSADDLIGKTDFDFFPADIAEQFRKNELDVMNNQTSAWIDQQVLFPDGKLIWLSTLKAPLYDQSGRVIGLITRNRDISEQHKLDEMKDQFVSTINHELRTPLTSINGALALLAAGAAGPLPEPVRRLVDVGHSNARQLLNLINDVLDLEKIESGSVAFDPSPVVLQDALKDAAFGFEGYLPEKNVRLRMRDQTGGKITINVEPLRLQQVLHNLISNAIKFSPKDSEVVLELTRDAAEIHLAILDEGPGVPPEFESRLFKRFEQADGSSRRRMGGTGLGLHIAKEIAERSGGRIWYSRRDGRVTAFTLSFPATTSKAAVRTEHPK